MILCRCGCGGSFFPSRATLYRMKRGDNVGYIPGHNSIGSKNPNWKGGRAKTGGGYILVKAPAGHPNARKSGYILEHRLVAATTKGDALSASEIVHHENEIKHDNRPENLTITDKPKHTRFHGTGDKNPRFVLKVPKECERCGKQFIPSHGNYKRNKYCSRKCTNTFGESALNAKLKDDDIKKIRALAGTHSHRALAKQFGIGKTQIGRILRRECR